MKNIFNYFLVMAALIGFTALSGCGDDDGDESPSITGTWESVKSVSSGCNDEDDNGEQASSCPDLCDTYVFNADGTYTNTASLGGFGTISLGGTYKISGNNIEFCIGGSSDLCYPLPFSVSGSEMTITVTDEDNGCTTVTTYKKK